MGLLNETLRLELAPFNERVITVFHCEAFTPTNIDLTYPRWIITGRIATEIFALQGPIELPKSHSLYIPTRRLRPIDKYSLDSLHLPVEKGIQRAANCEDTQDASMDRHLFATGVVSNSLKTKPKYWYSYWRGANSLLVCFVTVFFSYTFPVSASQQLQLVP